MPKGSMWRATTAFWTEDSSGQPVRVDKGDLVREGHEIVRNNPAAFELFDTPAPRFDVEETTAEPGRKRGERRTTTVRTGDTDAE